MKQPNLGYADVKRNFACMYPAGCARRVSLCEYCNLSEIYHQMISRGQSFFWVSCEYMR